MRIYKQLLTVVTVLWAFTAQGQLEKVEVREVYDAQVLRVWVADWQEETTLIIPGMYAPGIDQPYGKEARDVVAAAVLGKTVRIESLGGGEGGIAGLLFDEKGKVLNELLISKGLATADERETPWVKLQEEAKKKKLGIWKSGEPVDLEKDWKVHHKMDERVKKK